MSIYQLFNVDQHSHPFDIETAGKSILRQLNVSSLKAWLNKNKISYTDKNLNDLIHNMQKHVSASASVLLDPGLKDCYDAWLYSLENTSQQSITKARMMYMNAHKCDVHFGEGCFQKLKNATTPLVPLARANANVSKKLNCRWCHDSFVLDKFSILQCKCAARIGHPKCASKFLSEYKGRCPVCRADLLKRREISKYMFWSIDQKFKI